MFMDAIHVHAKEGGEHGKVRGNIPIETNDCLWAVHESWCRAKPPLHWIDDHKKDSEYMVTEKKIAQWIHEKLLMGVASETKRGLMNPKRVKGLVEIN